MNKTKQNKINRLNLWILIGICWLLPQVIIFYFSDNLQWLKSIILIFLGLFIIFGKSLDKFLLEENK